MFLEGKIAGKKEERFITKWYGRIKLKLEKGEEILLPCAGVISQWLYDGEKVEVEIEDLKNPKFENYSLWRKYEGEKIKVWPPFEEIRRISIPDPVRRGILYSYNLRIREAVRKTDFENIVELEQYHYASQKEVIGIWKCSSCNTYIQANVKPICKNCGSDRDVNIFEIKGSLPTSRFLILELESKKKYEPEVIGYVRVDPPVPKMNRRISEDQIIKDIREKVFPPEWISPLFHFEKDIEDARWKAIFKTATAITRIARVVIHPDYRADGLGKIAVSAAIDWIKERRVPEMKKKKELIEVIAQMARFNPFFEKVGFKYLWDTGSGRPVLYFPISERAKKIIDDFLEKDKLASKHKGKLYRSSYGKVEPIAGSIVFENVSKFFENRLDLENIPKNLKELLEDFGVSERRIQRRVLSNVNVKIEPKSIVALIGASGAGKTTFLRLIVGRVLGLGDERFKVNDGNIYIPENVKIAVLIPGEFEPTFKKEKSIIEHIYEKTEDEKKAVEILNRCGLSDAVLYRARFFELSTGQKERVKIASLLAESPNLLIIDELASHLDLLTAMRVTRRLSSLVKQSGITMIFSTHRAEVIRASSPDKILYVGYGKVKEDASF